MLLGSFSACGKVILLGEHFAVYGSPALALPLTSLETTVEVRRDAPARAGDGPWLESDSPGVDLTGPRTLLKLALTLLDAEAEARGWRVAVRSQIPVGFGLGSSAALSVALLGALDRAAGREPDPIRLNALAHRLEQINHGNPSGIDDTVVSRRAPIWFVRGEGCQQLPPRPAPELVLASSGRPGCTREAVAEVRDLAAGQPARFAELCATAKDLAVRGREALARGDWPLLGGLMARNQDLLRALGVSTAELDRLAGIATEAGALGAKLTGSGKGGFLVALCAPGRGPEVARSLEQAGAPRVVVMA